MSKAKRKSLDAQQIKNLKAVVARMEKEIAVQDWAVEFRRAYERYASSESNEVYAAGDLLEVHFDRYDQIIKKFKEAA